MEKESIKKIGDLLKSLTEVEYIYMEHCMGVRNSISSLIKRHSLSKEDILSHFELKETEYEDFILGNRNYDLNDIAGINALFMKLETEKLAGNVPCQIK